MLVFVLAVLFAKVLLFVLAIVFTVIVNIPAGKVTMGMIKSNGSLLLGLL